MFEILEGGAGIGPHWLLRLTSDPAFIEGPLAALADEAAQAPIRLTMVDGTIDHQE